MDPGVKGRMAPIIEAVLRRYSMVSREALTAPGKAARVVLEARSVCCWLARQLELPLTYPEIERALGRGDQAAGRGVARIEQQRGRDRWLREMTDALLQELQEQVVP